MDWLHYHHFIEEDIALQNSGKLKVFVGSTKKQVTNESTDDNQKIEGKNQTQANELLTESISSAVDSLPILPHDKETPAKYIWRVSHAVHKAIQEFGVDPLFALKQHQRREEAKEMESTGESERGGNNLERIMIAEGGRVPRDPLNFDFGAFEKLNRRFVPRPPTDCFSLPPILILTTFIFVKTVPSS